MSAPFSTEPFKEHSRYEDSNNPLANIDYSKYPTAVEVFNQTSQFKYNDDAEKKDADIARVKVVIPPNSGWLEIELIESQLDIIWKAIEQKQESHTKNLAGHVDNSYKLSQEIGQEFWDHSLQALTEAYGRNIQNEGEGIPIPSRHPFYMENWWVNFQKAGDFNPLHKHTGVYSFVIWVKIPTDSKEQNDLPIGKNRNGNVISDFEFTYTDISGRLRSYVYKMSKNMEGRMLIFPSWLRHQVYPFYNTDEDRISVSGNIFLDTSKTYIKDGEEVVSYPTATEEKPVPPEPKAVTPVMEAFRESQGLTVSPNSVRGDEVQLLVNEHEYPFWARDNKGMVDWITNAPPFSMIPHACKAHMTDWDAHKQCPDIEKLYNFIVTQLLPGTYGLTPLSGEVWGVRYGEGERIDWHNHRTSRRSFAYYANCPEGSSPLMFKEGNISIAPEEGKIVIFDGRLSHKVPPNKCDGRVIVSGNLFFE